MTTSWCLYSHCYTVVIASVQLHCTATIMIITTFTKWVIVISEVEGAHIKIVWFRGPKIYTFAVNRRELMATKVHSFGELWTFHMCTSVYFKYCYS